MTGHSEARFRSQDTWLLPPDTVASVGGFHLGTVSFFLLLVP